MDIMGKGQGFFSMDSNFIHSKWGQIQVWLWMWIRNPPWSHKTQKNSEHLKVLKVAIRTSHHGCHI